MRRSCCLVWVHLGLSVVCRELAAGVVNSILTVQDDLGNGDEGISALRQGFYDARKAAL